MNNNQVTYQELKSAFEARYTTLQWQKLGQLLAPKFDAVQLIGQIEPAEAEVYPYFRQQMAQAVSTRPHGFNLITQAKTDPWLDYPLSLYAVWTSIYETPEDDSSAYWPKFYEGLPHVSRTPQLDTQVGAAVLNVLKKARQLEQFKDVQKNVHWRHIIQILLHGLPAKDLNRFMRDYVLSHTHFARSDDEQRRIWLQELERKNALKNTLQRFLRRGEDVVQAFCGELQALRDMWNEKGEIYPSAALPQYIIDIFNENARQGPQVRTKRKHTPRRQTGAPELCLNLDFFLQPFVQLHSQEVSAYTNTQIQIRADAHWQASLELNVSPFHGSYYTEAIHPLHSGEAARKALLVPPAKKYDFEIETHRNSISPFSYGSDKVLTFDANNGVLCNLLDGHRWPERFLLMVKDVSVIQTDGKYGAPISLTGAWKDWACHVIDNASSLTLQLEQPITLKATTQRQQLRLLCQPENPVPYWVHAENGVLIVTDFRQLCIEARGLEMNGRLKLFLQHQSYPLYTQILNQEGPVEWDLEPEILQPGLYTLRLEKGLQSTVQRLLYLPGVLFERQVEVPDTPAQSVAFDLQTIPWSWAEGDSPKDTQIWRQNGRQIQPGSATALNLCLFADSVHETMLTLITQDIRWKPYGHAGIPHVSQMHSRVEKRWLHQLEDLHDTRLRVEVESALFQKLSQNNRQISVAVCTMQGEVMTRHTCQVHYHQYALWDLDMYRLLSDVLHQDLDEVVIGFQLGERFVRLVEVGLKLKLHKLSISQEDPQTNDTQINYQVTWTPAPTDPSVQSLRFKAGCLTASESPINLSVSTPGSLQLSLAQPNYPQIWGFYMERAPRDNPFRAFQPFEPEKAEHFFLHHNEPRQAIAMQAALNALFEQQDDAALAFESEYPALRPEAGLFFLTHQQLPETYHAWVNPLLQGSLRYTSKYVWKTATEALGEMGSEKVVDALIDALRDNNSDVREVAAEALGKIGSEKAVDALIDALNDKSSDVSEAAAQVLGKIGSEKAIHALIDALKSNSWHVSEAAAQTLGEIGSEKAVDALIDTLEGNNSDVSKAAAQVLGKIGSEKIVDALIKALKNNNSDVRQAAAEALGEIGSEKVVDALIKALENNNSDVRQAAAEALGEIGSEKAVYALIDALRDNDFHVRKATSQALKKIAARALEKAVAQKTRVEIEGLPNTVKLLNLALIYGLPEVRTQAAEALVQSGSAEAIEVLFDVLKNENWSIRRRAAEALGKIGSEKAVDALINALEDSNSDVRQAAAEALGKIGSEKAVDALIDALGDNDFHVRKAAAKSLKKIAARALEKAVAQKTRGEIEGAQNTVKLLRLALIYGLPEVRIQAAEALGNNNSDVREVAAEALGEIGSEKAIHALIDALKNNYYAVGEVAAQALGKIGSEKVVDVLIEALNDKSSDVREAAAQVLGKIGSEKAVDALIDALKSNSWHVRQAAAEALGEIDSEKVVDALVDSLKNNYYAVREAAAQVLGKMGSKKAVAALIDALKNNYSSVREAAAQALGEIGSKKAVDALIDALGDNNSDVRQAAAEALGGIGSEKVVDALVDSLKNNYYAVREAAAQVLGKIGSEKAIHALIDALKSNYYSVRQVAAEALGEIGSEKAVDALIDALGDNNSDVRQAAAEALGGIGSEKAVDTLIDALKNNDYAVGEVAVQALGKIGSEKAVDALINALGDKDFHVRQAAAQALGEIGSKKAINALIYALKDKNSGVRKAADRALKKIR